MNLYEFAEDYIKTRNGGVIQEDYSNLIFGGEHHRSFTSLNDVYASILLSAVNKQGANNSVKYFGRLPNNENEINRILGGSNPRYVVVHFNNWKAIYEELEKSESLIYTKLGKTWIDFCKTAYEAAAVLNEYPDFEQFKSYCDSFMAPGKDKSDLPRVLSEKIYGIGFALACDFLKELGYDFPKPDTHIRAIYNELIGTEKRITDRQICKYVFDTADKCQISSYQLDKILWVICSRGCMNSKDNFLEEIRDSRLDITF